MDFVSLCNLSDKCSTNAVNNGRPDANGVELGNVSVEESVVCDGIVENNEFNLECSSNDYPDDKLSVLANVNEVNSNDLPNSEGDLKLIGNVGVQIGKVEKSDDVSHSVPADVNENYEINKKDLPNLEGDLTLSGSVGIQVGKVEKSDDVSFSHVPNSQADIEVSRNGINLFVEVFGPLDGNSEGNRKESLVSKNEGKNKNECAFDVGDLVWVKTQNPLWWPGMIYNPSNEKTKPKKKGTFLVKYFGYTDFIWCNNSDLKPFIEYFEEMSKQNAARSFYGAVEGALFEIGQRVKSKMTCPCFSKENSNPEEKGKVDLEPVSFLACIKQIAGSALAPNKIELTVTKNRLSSFYRSFGHHELSLQTLCSHEGLISDIREDCDDIFPGGREKSSRAKKKRNPIDYDDLASPGKGSEQRDRKKSKFSDADDNNKVQETEYINSGKSSKNKWAAKFSKMHHVISKADDINASSSELLDELQLVAIEHSYLGKSKFPDSLRRFYIGFRSYAFLDAEVADKEAGPQPTVKKCLNETKRKKKESENLTANLESVNGKNPSKGKGKKKVEQAMQANFELGIGTNVYLDSSRMISFLQTNCNPNPSLVQPVPIPGLPDLNKSNPHPIPVVQIPSSVVGATQNVQPVPISGLPDLNKINPKPVPAVQIPSYVVGATQSVQLFNNGVINDTNRCLNGQFMMTGQAYPTTPMVINTGLASLTPPQQASQMEGLFPQNTGPPTRKMEEINGQFTPFIPDLNGTTSDPSPTPDGRKRAKTEPPPDPGGSLTLNFAPGSTLPTMEKLVTTFSRFGLVNPMGIQLLSEWSIQIPYNRTPDARFAHRSLEKQKPFGESLVSFDLHCVEEKKKKMKKNEPVVVVPVGSPRVPTMRVETQNVAFMKKNVEKMKQTLERMGDKVAPEMRARLESEIRAFLTKIGSMPGSSSS